MDSRGRVRETPVYCGAYFRFAEAPETVKKNAVRLIALYLAALVMTLVPMLLRSEYARQFYVFLPQAFALIPMYMFAAAILRIFSVKGDVIREHRDKIVNRLRNASIFFLIVCALSAISAIVFITIGEPAKVDWTMVAINIVRLVSAWLFLPLSKHFAMRQVDDSPKSSEK